MQTHKTLIYTCAFITSAAALFISHEVRQNSEEFIRDNANIVEAPWRLVAVPPAEVPAAPQKAAAAILLAQNEVVQSPEFDFSGMADLPALFETSQTSEKSIYQWVDDNGLVHYTDMKKGEKLSK